MQQWYMKITGYSMRHGGPGDFGKIHKSEHWARFHFVNRAIQQVNFMAQDVFAAMHNRFDIYIPSRFNERNWYMSKKCTEFDVSVKLATYMYVTAVPIPFRRLLVRKTYAQEESKDVC